MSEVGEDEDVGDGGCVELADVIAEYRAAVLCGCGGIAYMRLRIFYKHVSIES